MEKVIDAIIRDASALIKKHPQHRKAILQNYDSMCTNLKSKGFTDFVSHQWTISTLSKIYGSAKVTNAISTPNKNNCKG